MAHIDARAAAPAEGRVVRQRFDAENRPQQGGNRDGADVSVQQTFVAAIAAIAAAVTVTLGRFRMFRPQPPVGQGRERGAALEEIEHPEPFEDGPTSGRRRSSRLLRLPVAATAWQAVRVTGGGGMSGTTMFLAGRENEREHGAGQVAALPSASLLACLASTTGEVRGAPSYGRRGWSS